MSEPHASQAATPSTAPHAARPFGSVRGTPCNRYTYRDLFVAQSEFSKGENLWHTPVWFAVYSH